MDFTGIVNRWEYHPLDRSLVILYFVHGPRQEMMATFTDEETWIVDTRTALYASELCDDAQYFKSTPEMFHEETRGERISTYVAKHNVAAYNGLMMIMPVRMWWDMLVKKKGQFGRTAFE